MNTLPAELAAIATPHGTKSRGTLTLRDIVAPPGVYVAHAPPTYVSAAGRERLAADAAALKARPRGKPYVGACWSYDIYALARVEARAEATRRARRRAWRSRPGYVGLDRIVPRMFAGLRAVSA